MNTPDLETKPTKTKTQEESRRQGQATRLGNELRWMISSEKNLVDIFQIPSVPPRSGLRACVARHCRYHSWEKAARAIPPERILVIDERGPLPPKPKKRVMNRPKPPENWLGIHIANPMVDPLLKDQGLNPIQDGWRWRLEITGTREDTYRKLLRALQSEFDILLSLQYGMIWLLTGGNNYTVRKFLTEPDQAEEESPKTP